MAEGQPDFDKREQYLSALEAYNEIQGERLKKATAAMDARGILDVEKYPKADQARVRHYRNRLIDYLASQSLKDGNQAGDILEYKIELPLPTAPGQPDYESAALRMEKRFSNGRIIKPITTKEPRGRKKIAQMAASGIIYSFLSISSATCSLPLGT